MLAAPFVVSDTSPFQYLHRLGLLSLLPEFYDSVWLPSEVADELAVGLARGADVPDLARLPWVVVRSATCALPSEVADGLDRGESAALALAMELGARLVIIDDRAGRAAAGLLGLRCTGTVGILLEARGCGLVVSLRPLLDQLQAAKFRISARLRSECLRAAGEVEA